MSQNRRSFLRHAGMTIATALAARSAESSALQTVPGGNPPAGRFDFDTLPNRIGTDSTKWDQQIRLYGRDHVDVGMGIADMDFAPAPCITRAMIDRIQRDNWGYITVPESHVESYRRSKA